MTPLEINKKIQDLKKIPYDTHSTNCKEIPCFNWAEYIEDAWILFEEISEKEMAFIQRDKNFRYGDSWIVKIVLDYENRVADEFFAPTAPMAICLAYIAWREKNG